MRRSKRSSVEMRPKGSMVGDLTMTGMRHYKWWGAGGVGCQVDSIQCKGIENVV